MNEQQQIVRILAPAKVNLGLEVLSRRPDGYHEIHTVMQSISLFDRIAMTAPGSGRVASDGPYIEEPSNLMTLAARRLADSTGRDLDVDFSLTKRIPIAAGLGGGSSDAGAVLRLLCRHWRVPINDPAVREVAASVGSDVLFFLSGGRAVATGRGEQIRTLSALPNVWIVIVAPVLSVEAKTASLYGLLKRDDFSDGSLVRIDDVFPQSPPYNAFERPLYQQHPSIAGIAERLRSRTSRPVGLSGAGPAHYVMFERLPEAAAFLRELTSDNMLAGCKLHLARALSRETPLDECRNSVR